MGKHSVKELFEEDLQNEQGDGARGVEVDRRGDKLRGDGEFLNRGDIAVLWDSYWSQGLVLCVLARERNLKGSICFG